MVHSFKWYLLPDLMLRLVQDYQTDYISRIFQNNLTQIKTSLEMAVLHVPAETWTFPKRLCCSVLGLLSRARPRSHRSALLCAFSCFLPEYFSLRTSLCPCKFAVSHFKQLQPCRDSWGGSRALIESVCWQFLPSYSQLCSYSQLKYLSRNLKSRNVY